MDAARNIAIMIIDDDANLSKPENESISKQVSVLRRKNKDWGRVS